MEQEMKLLLQDIHPAEIAIHKMITAIQKYGLLFEI